MCIRCCVGYSINTSIDVRTLGDLAKNITTFEQNLMYKPNLHNSLKRRQIRSNKYNFLEVLLELRLRLISVLVLAVRFIYTCIPIWSVTDEYAVKN